MEKENKLFQVLISAPSSYAPFHITVSNHSIYESVLSQGHNFLCSLTLCRWEPLQAVTPWLGMDTRSLTLLQAGVDLASLTLASLFYGHQLKAFLYPIEMHKNTLSNLTKLPSNYKVLFAISYVISFQSCPVFFLSECIFRAGRFVGTQWEVDFEKR